MRIFETILVLIVLALMIALLIWSYQYFQFEINAKYKLTAEERAEYTQLKMKIGKLQEQIIMLECLVDCSKMPYWVNEYDKLQCEKLCIMNKVQETNNY